MSRCFNAWRWCVRLTRRSKVTQASTLPTWHVSWPLSSGLVYMHPVYCFCLLSLLLLLLLLLHFTWGVAEAKCIVATTVCSLSVCLSLATVPHYCMDPDVTWGNAGGCPVVVQYWADLQSVHGFHCYDNIHICKLIALYTENAYSTKCETFPSACTGSVVAYCYYYFLKF